MRYVDYMRLRLRIHAYTLGSKTEPRQMREAKLAYIIDTIRRILKGGRA